MARNLRAIGPGDNIAPEKPFFDRLVAIEVHLKQLREDRKVVSTEARDADIKIGALKHRVKRHLETEDARVAREDMEAESERIGRALGEFVNTPLGEAALQQAAADA